MTQFVGVDTSAKTHVVALSETRTKEFANTASGHRAIIDYLPPGSKVCMEATGNYGLDLAIALHDAKNVEVMVVNPRAARRFAEALIKRSKTDPVDAKVLREFAQRMQFEPWQPPRKTCLKVRALARRISVLTGLLAEEKNRLHAAESTKTLAFIRQDIKISIRHYERRIGRLQDRAETLIMKDSDLREKFDLLISVRGIAQVSAVRILAELCILPNDMGARQWVAHAGLDPRRLESGDFQGKTTISRTGNHYLRAALYLPALVAIQREPQVKAYREHLLAQGKTKKQAAVAVMRKLLHAIHGMFRHRQSFDGSRFYASAA